jgi:uncharacterized protein YgiM (DUF1202 family)
MISKNNIYFSKISIPSGIASSAETAGTLSVLCKLSGLQPLKIIFATLIMWFAATSVFCQTTTKYTTANLNLRQSANTKCKVLPVIPKGTTVTIDEDCDCKWILVSYKNQVGYVSAKYFTKKKIQKTIAAKSNSTVKYYTNTFGERIQSPTHYNAPPAGATALCRDGTYSFSRNRRGTCSHHGGVAKWL